MRDGDGVTIVRRDPRANRALPAICAVTASPGAVRGTNTTRPSLRPTPSPPAAMDSIDTLTTDISCAAPRRAQPASPRRPGRRELPCGPPREGTQASNARGARDLLAALRRSPRL